MQEATNQKTYFLVYISLLGLTLLTTAVAFVDLGPFNTVAALVIAFTKMTLVVVFFMHLRHASNLTRMALFAGLFWLALLICLTMTDYKTRSWNAVPQPWSNSAPATHP